MENEKLIRLGLKRLQSNCNNISVCQQSILAVQGRLADISKILFREMQQINEDIGVLNIILDRENAKEKEMAGGF